MQKRRNIIYIKPVQSDPIFVPEIISAGWDVHVETEIAKTTQLLEKLACCVVIVLLDTENKTYLDACEGALSYASGHVQWIALIPARYTDRARMRTLIAEYFYDYHTLPPDRDRLLHTLGRAYGMAKSILLHHQQGQHFSPETHEMLGTSWVMKSLFWKINKVAKMADPDTPVLITGESGTGKELTARAIHRHSSYAAGPFVAVNCGAIPTNLIQSELFGHEKGAFTGAYRRMIGRIESAQGGTIFLDEIGDLPLDLQVNLLRFLQEKTIERIGGTENIHVDVLVIAATHVDLEQALQEGTFREDLYYRLNVLHLKVPSLREREGDIETLTKEFFRKFSREKGCHVKGFTPDALRVMSDHDWPGNVRELNNRVRRALIMCEGRYITPEDLGLERRKAKRFLKSLNKVREEAEKEAIAATLRYTQNNVTNAADILGVSRATLYRLMEKHEISPESS